MSPSLMLHTGHEDPHRQRAAQRGKVLRRLAAIPGHGKHQCNVKDIQYCAGTNVLYSSVMESYVRSMFFTRLPILRSFTATHFW